MADREMVIKSLEECSGGDCCGCMYFRTTIYGDHCWDKLIKVAAELLKEQAEQIERLEHDLAITTNNLNYYINGND